MEQLLIPLLQEHGINGITLLVVIYAVRILKNGMSKDIAIIKEQVKEARSDIKDNKQDINKCHERIDDLLKDKK